MGPTRPLSLNKCNGSELSNAVALSPFRNITWPTSVSIHNTTLKGGKIHRFNDIREPQFVQHHLLQQGHYSLEISFSSRQNRMQAGGHYHYGIIYRSKSVSLLVVKPTKGGFTICMRQGTDVLRAVLLYTVKFTWFSISQSN